MYALLIVARILHIGAGMMWVGVMVFNARYLGPALGDVGPDAGKVMAALAKRGFLNFMPGVGAVSIVSGAYLYWYASSGFQPDFMGSGTGMTYGIGATLAVISYIIGMGWIRPSIKKSMALGPRIAEEGESERAALMAEMNAARGRAQSLGKLVAAMLTLAAVAMAVARYVSV